MYLLGLASQYVRISSPVNHELPTDFSVRMCGAKVLGNNRSTVRAITVKVYIYMLTLGSSSGPTPDNRTLDEMRAVKVFFVLN